MVIKAFCLLGLGLYVVLSVADFVLTFALLKLSDGFAYESNPIAAACLTHHGWGGLAAFKATVGFVGLKRKWLGAMLAVYGCSVLVSVILYSNQLIAEARQHISTRGPSWGPPPADPLKEPYLGLFAKR